MTAPATERKIYSTPVLRCYGSIVTTTLGSLNSGNDGASTKGKN